MGILKRNTDNILKIALFFLIGVLIVLLLVITGYYNNFSNSAEESSSSKSGKKVMAFSHEKNGDSPIIAKKLKAEIMLNTPVIQRDSAKTIYDKISPGNNKKDSITADFSESVTIVANSVQAKNQKPEGRTFAEIVKANILILFAILFVLISYVIIYIRISAIREKKKIKKQEREKDREIWEKLIE